jgi:hypothetical protein
MTRSLQDHSPFYFYATSQHDKPYQSRLWYEESLCTVHRHTVLRVEGLPCAELSGTSEWYLYLRDTDNSHYTILATHQIVL